MEKCHLIWIFLLTSIYLLAWNIQMKEIQIKNEKKIETKINVVEGKESFANVLPINYNQEKVTFSAFNHPIAFY